MSTSQARPQLQPRGDQADQCRGRLLRRLASGSPIAMMDMLAPDGAIGLVELVIMAADIGGGLRIAREDHGHQHGAF